MNQVEKKTSKMSRAITIGLIVVMSTLLNACESLEQSVLPAAGPVSSNVMPTISAENLNKREMILPKDLPGERTLILIAFEQKQQNNVNTWVEGMKLKENPVEWLETPIIDPKSGFVKFFIDNGMRSGIPDVAIRDRVVTLYTPRQAFFKSMGLALGSGTIYAAVVDRTGKVLALIDGDYTAEKAAQLLVKLKP